MIFKAVPLNVYKSIQFCQLEFSLLLFEFHTWLYIKLMPEEQSFNSVFDLFLYIPIP